jgi:hypothetical protein
MGNFGVCAARKYSTRKGFAKRERTRKKELKGPTGGAGGEDANKQTEREDGKSKRKTEGRENVCAAVEVREEEETVGEKRLSSSRRRRANRGGFRCRTMGKRKARGQGKGKADANGRNGRERAEIGGERMRALPQHSWMHSPGQSTATCQASGDGRTD